MRRSALVLLVAVASFCGVAGFKPTHGRLPVAGILPLSPSLDHPGPIAGNVGDLALIWQALAVTWRVRPRLSLLGLGSGPLPVAGCGLLAAGAVLAASAGQTSSGGFSLLRNRRPSWCRWV